MSKLLYNILKISVGQMPPLWLRAWLPQLFTCCIMVKAVPLFPTMNSSTYLHVTSTTIPFRGVTSGCKGGAIPRAPKSLRWAPKISNSVTHTSFNAVNLLPWDLRFKYRAAKLVLAPEGHLTSLPPWYHADLLRNHGLHCKGVTRGERGHNSPGAESLRLRGAPKIPTVSQVLSSMQYICFRKSSGSNIMGAPNLLLAPGAI